jgi:hypothetical protein
VLEKSLGLPQMQVHVVGPRGGPAPSVVLQPQGMDLKVLKDRVHALHEHRLRVTSGRVRAAPPPAAAPVEQPVELTPAPAR